ncbi:HNH endonuclease [Gordonia phage LilyPad]|nr:HNH endonuclease [Gordonia phage LilyPad]
MVMAANSGVEQWKPVVGFEGVYEVSDLGRVRSLPRKMTRANGATLHYSGLLLNPTPNSWGYMKVGLRKDGKKYTRPVHRLVLEAFVGPCPEGMEACHGPYGMLDNRVINLRWDTHSENMKDIKKHRSYTQQK